MERRRRPWRTLVPPSADIALAGAFVLFVLASALLLAVSAFAIARSSTGER